MRYFVRAPEPLSAGKTSSIFSLLGDSAAGQVSGKQRERSAMIAVRMTGPQLVEGGESSHGANRARERLNEILGRAKAERIAFFLLRLQDGGFAPDVPQFYDGGSPLAVKAAGRRTFSTTERTFPSSNDFGRSRIAPHATMRAGDRAPISRETSR
jgi:hypothetical protein